MPISLAIEEECFRSDERKNAGLSNSTQGTSVKYVVAEEYLPIETNLQSIELV